MRRLLFSFIAVLTFLSGWSQVIIYSECNYRGFQAALNQGAYRSAAYFKLPNDRVRSIKVPRGYQVELFSNTNFMSRAIVVTENTSCLSADIRNDVSSIKVSHYRGDDGISNNGAVSFYDACSYRGRVQHLRPGNYSNLEHVWMMRAPQSIQIPRGLEVILYSRNNYGGAVVGRYISNQDCIPSRVIRSARSMKVIMLRQTTPPRPPVRPQPRQ